jgi:death on curing protein
MKRPSWVLRETVLALHDQLLAEFGGPSGVRDQGLLASALARPIDKFAYEKAPLFELAAAYAFGLVKNHPFIDGNKRTGFAVAIVFLELNGYRFDATEADAAIQTLALAAGATTEEAYSAWIKTHARRRP